MNAPHVSAADALRWGLVVVVLTSLAGVVYITVTPQGMSDPYTELYVLGTDGNASDYPTDLSVGERDELIIGVTNHEHEATTYTVVLELGGETLETETLSLDDAETWRRNVSFVPETTGEKKLEILLFRGTDPGLPGEPYRRLWLQVEVTQ